MPSEKYIIVNKDDIIIA